MLNAHGGNSPLMTIVATEARVRFNMLAVATSWTRFGLPEGLISPEEKAIDIHGGDIETSVMLALHPDRVDMGRAEAFQSRQSEFASRYRHLRAYGPHAFGWKMSDLNKAGVAGNAAAATAEKGEAILAHAVKGIMELLQDVAAFDAVELS
jgi:creatinine amidohydrolase